MPIPDFQSLMLPVLRDLEHGERQGRDTQEALAVLFNLSAEERAARIPSGRANLFANRIGWAKTHMKMAGLIESPARSVYRLTDRGRTILAGNPARVSLADLRRFPEYVAYRSSSEASDQSVPLVDRERESRTPDDLIQEGYRQLRATLSSQLLEQIRTMAPAAFEQLVVDLLRAMGYGGTDDDAAQVVGGAGDGGIDGIIKEDKLGLDAIYIQAKRWQGTIGRPEIQRFAGALAGQRARKGVFITSSSFTTDALEYVKSIQSTIVLIDGARLTELMIDYGIGVTTTSRIEIKRLDSDYFLPD